MSLGGRFLTVTELELGTEYLTEGFVLEGTKLGLPVGIVDAAWCPNVVATAAKATKGFVGSIIITNPGQIKNEPQKIQLQVYDSGKEKEELPEEASKGEKFKEGKVIVCAIGR
jgi:hypothetical protein